jgi:hypothetical protein
MDDWMWYGIGSVRRNQQTYDDEQYPNHVKRWFTEDRYFYIPSEMVQALLDKWHKQVTDEGLEVIEIRNRSTVNTHDGYTYIFEFICKEDT